MSATVIREICAELSPVSRARRDEILGGPTDVHTHAWLYDEIAALRQTEVAEPSQATATTDEVRVLFWNAERGRYLDESAPRAALKLPGGLDSLLAEDPDRLMTPMRHEPMFAVARDAGFDWTGCNDGNQTQRLRDGEPARPLGRIDWFFARGLAVSDAATIPVVDAQDHAISNHDALAVTVRPAQ